METCSVYSLEGEDVIRFVLSIRVYFTTKYTVSCYILLHSGIYAIPYHCVFYGVLYYVILCYAILCHVL